MAIGIRSYIHVQSPNVIMFELTLKRLRFSNKKGIVRNIANMLNTFYIVNLDIYSILELRSNKKEKV